MNVDIAFPSQNLSHEQRIVQSLSPQLNLQLMAMLLFSTDMRMLRREQERERALGIGVAPAEMAVLNASQQSRKSKATAEETIGGVKIKSGSYCFGSSKQHASNCEIIERTRKTPLAAYDDLVSQISLLKGPRSAKSLAATLAGELNDAGYLTESGGVPLHRDDGFERRFASIFKVGKRSIDNALKLLHQCEPSGIGARDLQEALLIQLEPYGKDVALAREIVANWYDLFINKRIEALAGATGATVDDIVEAYQVIKTLRIRFLDEYETDDCVERVIWEFSLERRKHPVIPCHALGHRVLRSG